LEQLVHTPPPSPDIVHCALAQSVATSHHLPSAHCWAQSRPPQSTSEQTAAVDVGLVAVDDDVGAADADVADAVADGADLASGADLAV
jgi:hypothetical protein